MMGSLNDHHNLVPALERFSWDQIRDSRTGILCKLSGQDPWPACFEVLATPIKTMDAKIGFKPRPCAAESTP